MLLLLQHLDVKCLAILLGRISLWVRLLSPGRVHFIELPIGRDLDLEAPLSLHLRIDLVLGFADQAHGGFFIFLNRDAVMHDDA